MHIESQAHHVMPKLFKDIDIPHKIIMDGAKAPTMNGIRRKTREADYPTSRILLSFSDPIEGAICENWRRGLVKNQGRSCAPKVSRHYDVCLKKTSQQDLTIAHQSSNNGRETLVPPFTF